ncbi:MAG TPA: LPS assembly lipoprotein LptE [Usitatibacter sp.]|nr:LPS assembly lipoprotein LptE [Usitatibacter sp.]
MSARIVLVALMLCGPVTCGFQLRGDPAVGLRTLQVSAAVPSQVAGEIRRTLATGPTRVVTDPKDAQAQLRVLEEARDKSVATITGTGTVYEFELKITVRYELTVPGREIPVIAPTETVAKRLITYSASAPIAKEAEEQLLYRDMQVELAGRILRHVAGARREM